MGSYLTQEEIQTMIDDCNWTKTYVSFRNLLLQYINIVHKKMTTNNLGMFPIRKCNRTVKEIGSCIY